jgi:poly(A) polymerase
VLLWPAIKRIYERAAPAEGEEIPELAAACEQVIARQQSRIAVPKRFTFPLRDMIAMQPRFERREGRRALRVLDHPRFRAAYDFLLLRAASGEADPELATWWTEVQTLSADEKLARVEPAKVEGSSATAGPARRRRRRRRRPPPAV